jgi:hypothetical protein
MRVQITGMPCDTDHSFPAPEDHDWIDSMEYGAFERRPGRHGMLDVDTTPTWRMIAANMWGADCHERHREQVADDPYLTTHLIAAAVIVGLPRRPMLYQLALEQAGGATAINAMQADGLGAACEAVRSMSTIDRRRTVQECEALVLHGWVQLQMDIHDGVVQGRVIRRGE